jgi:hypothetical protein
MSASSAERPLVAAPELAAMREELRQESLTLALTGLSVAGFLLFAAMPYFGHLARRER